MAKCVKYKGNVYSQEEWTAYVHENRIELTKEILRLPTFYKYKNLQQEGEESIVPAMEDFKRKKAHADQVREDIRTSFRPILDGNFSEQEKDEQVEASLVLLDTLAKAWSDRVGIPKVYYYDRIQEVRQSNVEDLTGTDSLFQVLGIKGAVNLDAFYETNEREDALTDAEQLEENMGITLEDWQSEEKEDLKTRIKISTGWERNSEGKWIYEIMDGDLLPYTPSEGNTTLENIYVDEDLYTAYPQLRNTPVIFEYEENITSAYIDNSENLHINTRYATNKGTIIHEIYHLLSNIEGFERGGNPTAVRNSVVRIIDNVERGGNESDLSLLDRRLKTRTERAFGTTFFDSILQQTSIEDLASSLYSLLKGEVAARNMAVRSSMPSEQRKTALVSSTENVTRDIQLSNPIIGDQASIVGPEGISKLQNKEELLNKLEAAKLMKEQGVPISLIKKMTQWEFANNKWHMETFDDIKLKKEDMVDGTTHPIQNVVSGGEELFQMYPKLKDVKILFKPFVRASVGGSFNPQTQELTLYTTFKGRETYDNILLHEIQHFIQEEEKWLRGGNTGTVITKAIELLAENNVEYGEEVQPEDILTVIDTLEGTDKQIVQLFYDLITTSEDVENDMVTLYMSLIGEVEARNAANRSQMTIEEKLNSLVTETEGIDEESKIFFEEPVPETASTLETQIKNILTEVKENPTNFQKEDLIHRAAVETLQNGKKILHALKNPNVSTLAHEFAHIFEQDLNTFDVQTVEEWSGFKQGTTEYQEAFARGFETFMSEPNPNLTAINEVFVKFAKWLKELYASAFNSPLDIELTNEVRTIYSRLLNIETYHQKKRENIRSNINDMTPEKRKQLNDKLARLFERKNLTPPPGFRKFPRSKFPQGTEVVWSDGSIKVIGPGDSTNLKKNEREEWLNDMIGVATLSGLSEAYNLFKNEPGIKRFGIETIIPGEGKPDLTIICSA